MCVYTCVRLSHAGNGSWIHRQGPALCKMLRIEAYTQEEASEQWDVHNGSIICPLVLVVCDHLQAVGSEHTWHETRTE